MRAIRGPNLMGWAVKHHVRRLAVFVLTGVTTSLGVAPAHALTRSPAIANGGSTAVCTFVAPLAVTPGTLLLSPQVFHYTTNGESAKLTCVGKINGYQVTGPGWYLEAGTLTGTCVASSGPGHFTLHIQTAGGVQSVEGDYMAFMVAAVGVEHGPAIDSTFQGIPTSGLCVTPVTEVTLVQESTIRT
jgi:hypothetical protein